MNRRQFFLLPIVLAAACSKPPAALRNTDLSGATFARQLDLVDHNGQRRTLADFRGKAVVVFFGYTSCPDICPGTLSRLAEVMKRLGNDAARVQVLFVTLDPERDSAERLKEFVPWFYPSFLGLRGNPAEIAAATKEFRVFSARHDVPGGMGYVLDHTAGAYVYDPAGRLRLYVKDSAGVDDIAVDLHALLAG